MSSSSSFFLLRSGGTDNSDEQDLQFLLRGLLTHSVADLQLRVTGTVMLVSAMRLKLMTWRLMPLVGPSTKHCSHDKLVSTARMGAMDPCVSRGTARWTQHIAAAPAGPEEPPARSREQRGGGCPDRRRS